MEATTNQQMPTGTSVQPAPTDTQETFDREDPPRVIERLKEPFHPEVVHWVVTATSGGKDGRRRGLLAAYADPRAYIDRLNELFTPSGWTQEYSTQIIPSCPRKVRDKQVTSAKLLLICRLTIFGLGVHSGTGEGWADDDNALTSADAQAFKRAGVPFGLGRYFYDLPQVWVDLDEHDRPRWLPDLPAWALPVSMRSKANGNSGGSGRTGAARVDGSHSRDGHGSNESGADSRSWNGGEAAVVKEIEALSAQVGRGISRSVVASVAQVEHVTKVSDGRKLKEIAERLGNARRGVQRLKAAVVKAGVETLTTACRELKLPSTSTDDIPDTRVLRQLVDRLEGGAQSMSSAESRHQSGKTDKETGASNGSDGASGADFAALRNEVLTLARRLANSSKRPIAEVITWASDGTFQYADIGRLTAADVPKLQAAVRRLQEAVSEPKP